MSKFTKSVVVVTVCLASLSLLLNDAQGAAFKAMTFAAAAEPYAKEKYDKDGYVDTAGAVKNGGLGCSGYATAVLYRMRDGDGWKAAYLADWKAGTRPHQLYGDKIAAHFKLAESAALAPADLGDPARVKALIADKKLRAGGLYLFNVRHGEQGHVGFVRVGANGELTQSHYSGMKGYDGLASGEFRKWHGGSQYKAEPVTLYAIEE